jgi:HrpA-like RNA helicase
MLSFPISDVVYVVDCGRVKENRKDEINETPTLVECWVSRASAKQRRGRAGRVRPGVAYHMYSSHTYEHEMQDYQLPEMLRVGLEDLVLQILILDLGEPSRFLGRALDPPTELSMRNSLKLLEELGAVECTWKDEDGMLKLEEPSLGTTTALDPQSVSCYEMQVSSELTALGFHLATLPVDPRVGKMMIYGSLFGCIDPALTIAASMSARSPFVSPFDKRDEADSARKRFAIDGSDHLATLEAFKGDLFIMDLWELFCAPLSARVLTRLVLLLATLLLTGWKESRRSQGERAAQQFMRDNYLSRQTLFQIEDLRKQFANLLISIGFLPAKFRLADIRGRNSNDNTDVMSATAAANTNADNMALVKSVLCAGLYPNIIVAPRSLVSSTTTDRSDKKAGEVPFQSLNKGDVYLHPCTIAFNEKRFESRYCCYHEMVKTSKTYVRDCTTVSPFALVLFGGTLVVHQEKGVVTVDEWLKFRIGRRPATLVKHLRSQMEAILLRKIVSPDDDVTGSPTGKALIQSISTLLRLDKADSQVRTDGSEIVRPWRGSDDQHNNNGNNNPRGGRGGRGRGGRGRARGARGGR